MREAVHDVMQFHYATDTPVHSWPQVPDQQAIERRVKLIEEEFLETMRGLGYMYNISRSGKTPDRLKKVQYTEPDLVELADGLADLIYVSVGTALEFGIPMSRVWDEVQRSNMSKKDPVTGKVLKREDGKILKGPNFSPADVGKVMFGFYERVDLVKQKVEEGMSKEEAITYFKYQFPNDNHTVTEYQVSYWHDRFSNGASQ